MMRLRRGTVLCSLAAAMTFLGGCSGGGSGEGTPTPIPALLYVRAESGSDADVGTYSAPLRTLTQALALSGAGTSIQLLPGIYDVSNGEIFPQTIPDGVSVIGGAGVTIRGIDNDYGLVFAGHGALASVDIDGAATAILANGSGEQRVSNVRVSEVAIAVYVSGAAALDLVDSELTPREVAVTVQSGTASIRMSGGSISGMPGPCSGLPAVQVLDGTADLLGVRIQNNFTTAIAAMGSARVTVNGGVIEGNGSTGSPCGNHESLSVANTASLGLYGTRVVGSRGAILIDYAFGTPAIEHPEIEIVGSTLISQGGLIPQVVLLVNQANVRMRNSSVSGGSFGINVDTTGPSVGILDLGTELDPGLNTFGGNLYVGLNVVGATGAVTVQAAGNFWNANVQGADGFGTYATATVVGPIGGGANYGLQTAAQSIQF